MGDLVFLSGDFSSGSTLLWTLFRKTDEYHCLYEPLHHRLPEFLIYPLRSYEHHYFAGNYFYGYKGLEKTSRLFRQRWGLGDFHMGENDTDDELYEYLSYLIDESFRKSDRALLKFNRITFRLPWIRTKFPDAKIVHIHRDAKSQWRSIVSRAQDFYGTEDVGQASVDFNGMAIAQWCDDLQRTYPELASHRSQTGYERFEKLHRLSHQEHLKHATVSVGYHELVHDFDSSCRTMFGAVGITPDIESLRQLIVPPAEQGSLRSKGPRKLVKRVLKTIDYWGSWYARGRLKLRELQANFFRPG